MTTRRLFRQQLWDSCIASPASSDLYDGVEMVQVAEGDIFAVYGEKEAAWMTPNLNNESK